MSYYVVPAYSAPDTLAEHLGWLVMARMTPTRSIVVYASDSRTDADHEAFNLIRREHMQEEIN